MSLARRHSIISRNTLQVEFINASTGTGSGGVTTDLLTVNYPSPVYARSYLLLVVTDRTNNQDVTTIPYGWTPLFRHLGGTTRMIKTFYRIATGNEAGSFVVDFDNATSNQKIGRIFQFRNVAGVQSIGTSFDAAVAAHTALVTTSKLSLAVSLISLIDNLTIGTYAGATGGTWSEPVPETSLSGGNGAALGINIAPMPNGGTLSGGTQALVNNITSSFILTP